jgi:hypothetical protein
MLLQLRPKPSPTIVLNHLSVLHLFASLDKCLLYCHFVHFVIWLSLGGMSTWEFMSVMHLLGTANKGVLADQTTSWTWTIFYYLDVTAFQCTHLMAKPAFMELMLGLSIADSVTAWTHRLTYFNHYVLNE